MSDTVDLTIRMTADAREATKAADTVADAYADMATDVSKASDKADAAVSSIDNVAGAADNMDSKMGAATGSLGALAGGLEAAGFEGAAAGLQSAATATDFLSGAGGALNLVLESQALAGAKAKAAQIAYAAASKVSAAGQWALNAALSANPIGLVVLAVAALVAGLVLAYNKSETFRNIVDAAMGGARDAVGWVVDKVDWLVELVKDKAPAAWTALSGAADTAADLVVGYVDTMTAPIQAVIDLVQDLIGYLKDIDLPDPSDLPIVGGLLGRTSAGGGGFGGVFGRTGGAGGGGGAGIYAPVTVHGYVGNDVQLARVIEAALAGALRRAGVKDVTSFQVVS